MSDNVTNIEEARYQRHKRQLQQRVAQAAHQAAAAYLAHLEAVARGAPREVVNRRWQMVEERAVAYQELLQVGEDAARSGLDLDLREQIDEEFEVAWLELLREECLALVREDRASEAGLHLACLAAYRQGYATGMIGTAGRLGREGDE